MTRFGEDLEQLEPSIASSGNIKWPKPSEKKVWQFLKLNIQLPYDAAVSLLGIYPRKIKAYVSTKICNEYS